MGMVVDKMATEAKVGLSLALLRRSGGGARLSGGLDNRVRYREGEILERFGFRTGAQDPSWAEGE